MEAPTVDAPQRDPSAGQRIPKQVVFGSEVNYRSIVLR